MPAATARHRVGIDGGNRANKVCARVCTNVVVLPLPSQLSRLCKFWYGKE